MQPRAFKLISLSDEILFVHGGCHVFAFVLQDIFSYPLLSIRDAEENHHHIACNPEKGFILDFFGWFSYSDYIKEDRAQDLGVMFHLIEREALKKQFINGRGKGFYYHCDFWRPAEERARKWIKEHFDFFNGSIKRPIPGISRVKTASGDLF